MDAILQFTVANQTMERTDEFTVVEGSENYLQAQFTCTTPDWDGMIKTAVFIDADGDIHPSLCSNDICDVPADWLVKQAGYVSLIGSDGTTKITTKAVKVNIKEKGYTSGGKIEEESQAYFDQLLAAFSEKYLEAEVQAKLAQRWAVGLEEEPETMEDNAKYYAGQARNDAVKTQNDRNAVSELSEHVDTVAMQVNTDKTEAGQYKEQAAASETNALQSGQAAKSSETAAKEAQAGAEAAEGQAEIFANQTAEDRSAVEAAKSLIMQMGQEVADNKASVEQAVSGFEEKHQQAVTNVKTAEEEALNNIGTGLDNTLSVEGKAADAGATGKAIDELKGDLTNIDALEKERKIPFISAYSKSTSTTNYIAVVIPSSLLEHNKSLSFDVYCEDDVRPYLMMYDCDMSLVGNNRLIKRIGSPTYTDVKTGNWYHYEGNRYTLNTLPSKEKIALVFNLVPNDSVKRIIEGYICNIKLDNNICDTKIEDVFLYSASATSEDIVKLYDVGILNIINHEKRINAIEDNSIMLGNGKILCIGDSLTAGIYSNETTPRKENYPYFMKRIVRNESINFGKPGYSASMFWNNNIHKQIDFSDVKHIIIMLGTNGGLTDTLDADVFAYNDYNDYATTKTGCYCKIIEYCMEQAPTAHIYLCTTPFFDKIRQPNFAPPTTPDANIVIPKIAEFYGLRVFDVRNGLGVNSKNTNTIQLDGLHGQKEFYERLGTFIGSQLRANASWVE